MTGRRIVTEWFRVPKVWPLLAAQLATMDRPVTVWSGACGTGQEAYSAAILLIDRGIPGHVIATDIDRGNLATARRAVYAREDLERDVQCGRLTADQVARHFDPARGDGLRVRREVRDRVQFGVLNLRHDRLPACDVALVRNVWRHLARHHQWRLARGMRAALPADGRLVLGYADWWVKTDGGRDMRPGEPAGLRQCFTPAEGRAELIWRPRHET